MMIAKRKFIPRFKVWKIKNHQTRNQFHEVFNLHMNASAGVADAATEDIWNNIKTDLLKTTEEVCGTTQPVKPGGRMSTWKRPLLPSGKLSRHERLRLVKALWHHKMQPNASPDKQCTMLVKKPTRRSTRILTPSLQNLPHC